MKVVLLGATKGMGRALARRLAGRGDALYLLGRDETDLAAAVVDLETRRTPQKETIAHGYCDLELPDGFGAALDGAIAALGGLDIVIVTAGLFGTQDRLEADPKYRRRLLEVDFVRTVEFCEAARERLLARGGGTLCVFGSVAGDRGRKPVVLYGAAKAGLAAYLEGLDHRFHSQGLRVITVKPGFVRTGMTAGLAEPPFAGEADEVAARVVRAIDRGWPVVYAPPIWALVMLAVRNLPRGLMRRLGF
ncbi:MAG: SDR family NAD(P)-dependent oxidoreductase [Thermoanaerobaculia bacterium]|nr:SDR family NAD(P)-dependent oxidoreductase [Thermoanaerobaculia bacterium]MBP9823663.1 SDR family NAD(P)-dependent oxidoreductase [Thermoanaerobaculia bacterium]